MVKAVKQAAVMLLRFSVSVALLFIVFRQVDNQSLAASLKNADLRFLSMALAVFSCSYMLCLMRWRMLLHALDIKVPLKRIVVSYAGGVFFNLFLPSTIGGDFVRSVDLSVHTKRAKDVVATVFLDRLSGYVGLVIVAIFALWLGRGVLNDKSVFFAVNIISAVLFVALIVLFNNFVFTLVNKLLESLGKGRIRDALRNLHQEIYYFRNHKRVIVCNIMVSVISQLIFPLVFYLVALSLGIKLELIYFYVFIPIIGAISLLPISIGGLGLRDASMVYFFAKVGLAKNLAFAMSILNFFFMIIFAGIGGLIYVLSLHNRRV